jgi:hypothetical protein
MVSSGTTRARKGDRAMFMHDDDGGTAGLNLKIEMKDYRKGWQRSM